MKIVNLAGLFTFEGFTQKQGRKVTREDAHFVSGPVDLLIDPVSGKILNTQPATKSESKKHDGSQILDGTGLVATAAFVDSHTHAIFGGDRSSEFFMRWQGHTYVDIARAGGGIASTFVATQKESDTALLKSLEARLLNMRRSGTATVEIKSGYGANAAEEIRLLRLIQSLKGRKDLPEIFVTFLGLHAIPAGKSESAHGSEMIEALKMVAKEKLADFVDAFPEHGFFSLAESQRFVAAAAKLGVPAKIHADEITHVKATESFCPEALSVDHLQKVSEAGIKNLALARTVATLLPATSFYLGLDYAPARPLLDAGARVALASDYNPGTAPSSSMLFTMLLAASQFKMTAAEIWCGVTLNGAAALGAEKHQGALLPGYTANILLWEPQQKNAEALDEIIAQNLLPHSTVLRGTFFSN